MNRTTIEYVVNPDGTPGYSWNPVTGCLNGCPYCYARRIAERFKGGKAFPKGFEPTFHPERLLEPVTKRKPSTIFACDMADLWATWIPGRWREDVLREAFYAKQHTFLWLTKDGIYWRYEWWRDNWWAGRTIDTKERAGKADQLFIYHGKHWLSFEPLLEDVAPVLDWDGPLTHWIVIGAMTGPGAKAHAPQPEWVGHILAEADKRGIPCFMKDNLRPYWQGEWRREIPWLKGAGHE